MTRVIAAVMLTGAVLAGCSSPCRQIRNAAEDLKARECSPKGTDYYDSVDEAACEEGLDQCNDADRKILEDEADCLDEVGTCVEGKQEEWRQSVFHCLARSGLSQQCLDAIDAIRLL